MKDMHALVICLDIYTLTSFALSFKTLKFGFLLIFLSNKALSSLSVRLLFSPPLALYSAITWNKITRMELTLEPKWKGFENCCVPQSEGDPGEGGRGGGLLPMPLTQF